MNKEPELWPFIAARLHRDENVVLLVVAESSGSSPGRKGYKMAVGADGELCGSIGGGVMEIDLVEQSRKLLSEPGATATGFPVEQVHQKNSPYASGMICSGKQSVIFRLLTPGNIETVHEIIDFLKNRTLAFLTIGPTELDVRTANGGDTGTRSENFRFQKLSDTDFAYSEKLGFKNDLYIIGGGHCSLALSELMSKMDFHISIFDDRPGLNTIEKNKFSHCVEILKSYDRIGEKIDPGPNTYIVVMTVGYKYDDIVIRQLLDKEFKYFGVLGSRAKMAALMKELKKDGFAAEKLARIHTPIGLPITSRTPEEIAVSIAAEIISIKNA